MLFFMYNTTSKCQNRNHTLLKRNWRLLQELNSTVKLKLMCLEIIAFQNQHSAIGLGMKKKCVIWCMWTEVTVWKEGRLWQLVIQNLIKLFTVGLWKRERLELMFSLQKQIHKQIHFHRCFLCMCTYKHLFIGPYICYLHLKNMHYFWWMNIINETSPLLFSHFCRDFIFHTNTGIRFILKSANNETITGNKTDAKRSEYMDSLFSSPTDSDWYHFPVRL